MPVLAVHVIYTIELVGAKASRTYIVQEVRDLDNCRTYHEILVKEEAKGKVHFYGPFQMSKFDIVFDKDTGKVEIRRIRP